MNRKRKEELYPLWGMMEMIRLILNRITPRSKKYSPSQRIWRIFAFILILIFISIIIAQIINHGNSHITYFFH